MPQIGTTEDSEGMQAGLLTEERGCGGPHGGLWCGQISSEFPVPGETRQGPSLGSQVGRAISGTPEPLTLLPTLRWPSLRGTLSWQRLSRPTRTLMSVSRAQGLGWGDWAGLGSTVKGAHEGTPISSPCCSPRLFSVACGPVVPPAGMRMYKGRVLARVRAKHVAVEDVVETGLVLIPLG